MACANSIYVLISLRHSSGIITFMKILVLPEMSDTACKPMFPTMDFHHGSSPWIFTMDFGPLESCYVGDHR